MKLCLLAVCVLALIALTNFSNHMYDDTMDMLMNLPAINDSIWIEHGYYFKNEHFPQQSGGNFIAQ